MPQGCSVGSSMTSLRRALTLSRSDSSWSMSLWPITDRSEVCDLRYCTGVVLHVDDGLNRVDDPVIHNRVHPQRDVVPGDGILGRDRRHDNLHVDLAEPVSERV